MGVEGGNFYEGAITRQQNLVERQEEREAIDERLERVDVAQETQGLIESVQVDVEQQEKVQSMLLRFESLSEKEGSEGIEVFKTFVLSADSEIKALFLDRTNSRNLKKTVEISGRFPVNEFEFQQSIIEGSVLIALDEVNIEKDNNSAVSDTKETLVDTKEILVDIKEAVSDTKEAASDTKEAVSDTKEAVSDTKEAVSDTKEAASQKEAMLRKNGEHILSIHNNIPLDGYTSDFSRYSTLMKSEQNWSNAERKEIIHIQQEIIDNISKNRELEKKILPQAQAQGPEVFNSVVSSLVALEPSLQFRIDAWKITPDFSELPPEHMVRVSGALGTRVDEVGENAEQSGNIFTLRQGDGTEINYDVVSNERTLEFDGYSLSSQVEDTGDYQTPKLEYMRVEQEHLPKIKIIAEISELLSDKQVDTDDLAEIKATIQSISGASELGIDFMSMDSGKAIKEALQSTLSFHQSTLETAREEYRTKLLRLRDTHMAGLDKKDRKTKKVLQFLESIGFTMIPQSVTNNLIQMLNDSPGTRSTLGMSEKIDLANGGLGFDRNSGESEDLDLLDRQGFVEFMNRILTGDPKVPIEYVSDKNIQYHAYGDEVNRENIGEPRRIMKANYENMLQSIVGDINFSIRARNNLFKVNGAE